MISELYAVFILAFGLGLVHALDADHIAAVSVLSSEKSNANSSLVFAIQWAIGHGLMLMLMSILFFWLGQALPGLLSAIAESIVGVVLILLGVMVIYKMQRQRLHIHFHTHQGLLPHAHWHQHQTTEKKSHQHRHKATLVGSLHGMAGSAPLLLSLPLIQSASIVNLSLYITIFSFGVLVAMICFGGLLSVVIKKLTGNGQRYLHYLRFSVAMLSIVIGVRLVSG